MKHFDLKMVTDFQVNISVNKRWPFFDIKRNIHFVKKIFNTKKHYA